MEKLPCISIIIPAYNAEKYIEKCIQSIIHQDYRNLEIIIVNDGSIDKTREICEKFVNQDKRIRLINTENKGAGSARNTGIDVAKGEYISFIDSDDYICPDYYSRMYTMLREANADIAEGHYKRVKNYDEDVFTNTGKEQEYTNIEKLLILYGNNEIEYINSVIVTNKLYRRELFKEVKFPVNRIIDDEFIIYKLIYNSKKIISTSDIMYAYVQSEESVMRASFKEKRVHDTLDVYDEVYEFFKDKGNDELIEKILIRYLEYGIELTQKTSKSKDIIDKNKVYEYIRNKFEEKAKIAKNKIEQDRYNKIKNQFNEILGIVLGK